MMYLPSSSKLNIPDFSHIFDNKSECYKLFWFKAIMRSVEAGQRTASFETLIDEMIADDELWNLNPTIREINSAKSNNLPEWDRYFGKLVDQEYKALKVTWENDAAFTAFLDCQKAHVNSDEVKLFLYTEKVDKTEFGNRLEKILLPVYESAKNSGFREWVYEP